MGDRYSVDFATWEDRIEAELAECVRVLRDEKATLVQRKLRAIHAQEALNEKEAKSDG